MIFNKTKNIYFQKQFKYIKENILLMLFKWHFSKTKEEKNIIIYSLLPYLEILTNIYYNNLEDIADIDESLFKEILEDEEYNIDKYLKRYSIEKNIYEQILYFFINIKHINFSLEEINLNDFIFNNEDLCFEFIHFCYDNYKTIFNFKLEENDYLLIKEYHYNFINELLAKTTINSYDKYSDIIHFSPNLRRIKESKN
ncbi:MAG: hypothetical protein E7172_00295 [Firmicutes bacterium]|nr:hypothetical protein [Bacillota bacterium]